MQVNECNYCGATLASSVFKCTNCGGQVRQSEITQKKKFSKKKIICLIILLVIIIPVIYKTHLDNTAKAVIAKLQTNSAGEDVKHNDFLIRAKFTQALVSVTPIKLYITEFIMSTGHYPETFRSLGLNPGSLETGAYIQTAQLLKQGTIRIDLSVNDFGKNKFFTLTPKEIMGGTNIQWSCASNLERRLIPTLCQTINL